MLLIVLSLTTFAVLTRIIVNPLSNVFQKQLAHRSADPLFIISSTYGFLMLAVYSLGISFLANRVLFVSLSERLS